MVQEVLNSLNSVGVVNSEGWRMVSKDEENCIFTKREKVNLIKRLLGRGKKHYKKIHLSKEKEVYKIKLIENSSIEGFSTRDDGKVTLEENISDKRKTVKKLRTELREN